MTSKDGSAGVSPACILPNRHPAAVPLTVFYSTVVAGFARTVNPGCHSALCLDSVERTAGLIPPSGTFPLICKYEP
ncbi:MAG: hypothetical protein ISS71_02910 [Phycisphaerae bacterium]|nr:hypothetical protein [Phycisphaerae bacterium]